MKNSFYTADELKNIGFQQLGRNVFISRHAHFYRPELMCIGSHVRIDDFCILSGQIKIGNYIHIGAGTTLIAGTAGIELEDFSGLSHRVNIFAVSDDFSGRGMIGPMIPDEFRNVRSGKVLLQKHTVVGCGSVILPGVTLAEGSAVGALSLVIRSTQPWKTYGGHPARATGSRSQRVLELEKKFLESLGGSL